MKNRILLEFTVFTLLLGSVSTSFATVSFQGIGDLPGGYISSGVRAVSADGLVVVGASGSALGVEAYRWTRDGGMQALGDLPGGNYDSSPSGVSADGSVVVGGGNTGYWESEAFRWAESEGMVGMGNLLGDFSSSTATAVSADGSVVVGGGDLPSGWQAYYWTESEGITLLGNLSGGDFESGALDVSADGRAIVGASDSALGTEAFYWTASDGMRGIGFLPDKTLGSGAFAISDDGFTVVGSCVGTGYVGTEAFRWRADTGMVGLGDLPGGLFRSVAYDVSADGSVIVGNSRSELGGEAFIWDQDNGMRNLTQVLTNDYGLDLTGWRLGSAQGVSADGLTIVGNGINPDGYNEGWIVKFSKPVVKVAIDIRPSDCPNRINVKSKGVLSAVICGSEGLDVAEIDVASIRLAGVTAIRSSFEDVARPLADANECECFNEGADGYLDLKLKFDTQTIIEALGEVVNGDQWVLELTGTLYDETEIAGEDCVIINAKSKPSKTTSK